MSTFHFKQFSVRQDRCAMKVGTDGILLGAWANVHSPGRILDIGTGTGLLALMLAQRFPEARIDAIELDPSASAQASDNVSQSPFAQRISVWQADARTFSPAWTYDLVVCNPPYFADGPKPDSKARQRARDASFLSQKDLIEVCSRIAHAHTCLAFVLPYVGLASLEQGMAEARWYPNRRMLIQPNAEKSISRALVQFGRKKYSFTNDVLTLQTGNPPLYTADFRSLTQDFYTIF